MNNRPVGVSILAVLHLVGGVLLLGAQVLLLQNLDHVSQGINVVGIPPILLVVGVMLLAGIALASGIGMWLGTRWGWWCATFYYVHSIARNANALLMLSNFADELAGGSRGPGYYYAKFGGRVIMHFLLLMYFFKSNVLQYFGMDEVHKEKAVGKLITVTAAISGLSTAIALIAE